MRLEKRKQMVCMTMNTMRGMRTYMQEQTG